MSLKIAKKRRVSEARIKISIAAYTVFVKTMQAKRVQGKTYEEILTKR